VVAVWHLTAINAKVVAMTHRSADSLPIEREYNKEMQIKEFFESLHASMDYHEYTDIYDEAVHFKDPFHEVYSLHQVVDIFLQMFQNLDNPHFKTLEYIRVADTAYLQWQFMFHYKNEQQARHFTGVSRLRFNSHDKIIEHVDYWDAAEHVYESFPLLGSVLRIIKRNIAKRKRHTQ